MLKVASGCSIPVSDAGGPLCPIMGYCWVITRCTHAVGQPDNRLWDPVLVCQCFLGYPASPPTLTPSANPPSLPSVPNLARVASYQFSSSCIIESDITESRQLIHWVDLGERGVSSKGGRWITWWGSDRRNCAQLFHLHPATFNCLINKSLCALMALILSWPSPC